QAPFPTGDRAAGRRQRRIPARGPAAGRAQADRNEQRETRDASGTTEHGAESSGPPTATPAGRGSTAAGRQPETSRTQPPEHTPFPGLGLDPGPGLGFSALESGDIPLW